ncbi:MAG: hypothetical protein GXX96_07365 [Planctomycetaceae bacterium]|nr:hypothetical protein [Planctomycetaceae bacterium]
MRLLGLASLLVGLAMVIGCGGGASSQYEQVDPAVDLANAVKADIEQMKTAEGGAAGEAVAFVENMEQRVSQAPAESKAVYEQIYAKAKELNELADSKASKGKLDAVVAELEKLAGEL